MVEQKTRPFQIRPVGKDEGDRAWVVRFVTQQWGADIVVVHDTVYYLATLPGFVVWQEGERVGLVAYHLDGDACEIVALASLRPGIGMGEYALRAVTILARLPVIVDLNDVQAERRQMAADKL